MGYAKLARYNTSSPTTPLKSPNKQTPKDPGVVLDVGKCPANDHHLEDHEDKRQHGPSLWDSIRGHS